MSLNSNALTTLANFRVYQGSSQPIKNITANHSGSWISAINASSQEIIDYLGYSPLSGSLGTDIFSGRGILDEGLQHYEHQIPYRPIVSTRAPKLYIRSNTAWTAETGDYTFDSTRHTIYYTDGSYFTAGHRNYKVELEYGYDGVASLPSSLQRACHLLTDHIIKKGERYGMASSTTTGVTTSYNLEEDIPGEVKRILERFRRGVNDGTISR